MNSEEATKDFLGRIKMYEEVYQKIDLDENLSFIKLINIGEDVSYCFNRNRSKFIKSKDIYYQKSYHI